MTSSYEDLHIIPEAHASVTLTTAIKALGDYVDTGVRPTCLEWPDDVPV
jgi:hypothetical protein